MATGLGFKSAAGHQPPGAVLSYDPTDAQPEDQSERQPDNRLAQGETTLGYPASADDSVPGDPARLQDSLAPGLPSQPVKPTNPGAYPSYQVNAGRPPARGTGLVAVLMVLTLLAVAAGGVVLLVRLLFSGQGAGQQAGQIALARGSDPSRAPDFLDKPRLSAAVKVGEGLPAGVSLDQLYPTGNPGFAVASLVACEDQTNLCDQRQGWLRGVSLDEGTIQWTLDLAQFGVANPDTVTMFDVRANQMAVIITDKATSWEAYKGAEQGQQPIESQVALALIDTPTGWVLDWTSLTWFDNGDVAHMPFPIALAGGTLAVGPLPGAPTGQWVNQGFRAGHFDQPTWTAASLDPALAYELRGPSRVTRHWVATPEGMVSTIDGAPAPWGQDISVPADPSDQAYRAALPVVYYSAVSAEAIFRVETTEQGTTCTRWDINTDQALWHQAVACAPMVGGSAAGDEVFFFNQGTDEARTMVAVTADAGAELWSSNWAWVHADLGEALLLRGVADFSDNQIIGTADQSLVNAASGEEIGQSCPLDIVSYLAGSSVYYCNNWDPDSTRLEAWSLASPGDKPLWVLDFSADQYVSIIDGLLVVINPPEASYQVLVTR